MAQCKLTPHEFIQNAFSPMVAVMCSSYVDQTCQKNNLSFIEMIQPFCKLNTEAHFREPSGTLVTVRNLRITMLDVNSRPPQPTLARKFLNESVSMSWNERNTSLQIGGQTIEVPASVPWFEAWRETFLQVQFPSDHEFTKHYVACILVVSSAENNPTDTLQHMEAQLQQLQTVTPAKLPKWFCSKVLRYYVLLHDAVEGDGAKAENTLGAMKQVYGDNLCFFLQTNSRPPGQNEDHSHLPDPWSQFLTRQLDVQDGSDQESSPRTPAEIGGVTGMPSHVMTDGNMDGDVARPPNMGPIVMSALEVAQEAGENAAPVVVTHHPLSPDTEHHKNNYGNDVAAIPSHINANVWVGQSTTATLQHGAHLTACDLDRLRMLVQEFCIKALLPYVERQIQQLSDTISNKKGVSRSLFSATKRWFGSNKPGSPGSNTPLNAVIYSSDAPELQMRRLGDLCFMFNHYSLAFQAYHSAKRDFNADQAWLYYAGALEMAALSAFMQGEVTRKAQEYMDEAIVTYLNSCKMQQFATRATLLSTECLKGRSLYGEAAKQFIRMTSEDSDLRSALLLEQASYCFLKATRPRMLRKYAFHIVLAGHRFSKASQRKHSLRCYRQAYQVYENKNWSLAEDHIHFTIGRQAANLKQISEATQAFAKLLTPASRQSATQQAAFLREFLVTQQQLIAEEGQSSLPVLPLPLIDGDSIKVLMGDLPFHPYCDGPSPVVPATGISFAKDSTSEIDARWGKLEELLITEAQGSLPMIFKPTVQLYTNETNNTSKPVGIVMEPVTLSIMLQNPLHMPLPLGNLRLLWRFAENEKQDNIISNETAEPASSPIETQCLETLLLNPHCTREVILKVVPRKVGELDILGLAYDIENPNESTSTVTGKQVFRIRTSRPHLPKSRTTHELHDRRLELSIVKPAPCLQVLFRDLCSEMLCGEIRHIGLEFCNTGSTPLTSLYVASLNPELYSLGEPAKVANVTQIALPGGQLSPGQIHSLPMWLRAPDTKGPANLDMLFYYENPDSSSIPRYRLVRHFWQLSVLSSVQLSSTAFRSCRAQEEVLNLKLCIKNCSQIHDPWIAEIYLLQISLAGHKWRLAQDVVVPSDVKLQAQEQVHFLAKVQRHHGPNSEEKIFSDVLIAQQHETAGLKRTSPYIDFFHRYQQSISEPTKSEVEFENVAKGMETALKLDAILVVRWRASVTAGDGKKWAALGQSHLLLDQVGTTVTWPLPPEPTLLQEPLQGPLQIFGREDSSPTTPPYVSLDVLQKLVTYTIMHSPCIKHDFKCSRLCVVPVQLILQNCCDNQLVVRVNSISNSSSVSVGNKNQLYSPHPSSAFRWVGLAETWMELEPHGSTAVQLSAAVGSAGTYNLGNRLEILCRAPEAPETDAVAQSWRIESSLIVISSIKS